ncbi:Type II secretory pathway ATPase GspE/PulE or T4P pilus assembly pathway ATPase PilB [Duganella sp. CF402]|uniref:GspE/PulE family protein n=1 Tax=unclassified Duganella TaxID=2636909 RepID=UPI0008BA9657|nr:MULTISPECIES: GspE/PulE family protein [unclassified Duganella]RZT09223.1 type II secretory ATPase GspE/PulE/Tfp pilus assembly ATPase PilB-like protein [Duganella sp. BK701]SEL65795.1 Type II secretory pathway ATPase GspE/PulE or T4P pilus assembly pathway ATPase PilB [Duganella sp. CF402]
MNDAGVRPSDVDLRLAFFQKLQAVTTKIHATSNLDEIMLDLGMEFCDLFNCDRFTLYALDQQKDHIVSKVKTGLTSFRDLKLAITPASIAGYVALTRKTVNLADVYDQNELNRYSPELRFQQGVDQRTGYRTKQMLVAPLISVQSRELLGVVQFINNRDRVPFSAIAEEGVKELCETLSVAFSQRMKPPQMVRTKYDGLVTEAVISAQELEAATRSARAKELDIEDVLIDEYEIKPAAIGVSLEKHFGVPYEHFRADRLKPVDLLKNLKRQYVEESGWIPLEDNKEGLLVAALDPERVAHTHIVEQIFPRAKPVYRVTSHREFRQMVELFYGHGDSGSVGDLLSGMDDVYDEDGEGAGEVSEAVENELVKLLNKIIMDAYRQGVSDIHIEPLPGKGKTGIRFRKDGTLVPYIEIPASYRSALVARVKIMCDLDISERRKPQDGKIKFKKYGPLDIELRVATIPSSGGVEDIVMRILAAGEPIPLDKLGVLPFNLERLRATVSKPYGLFFVCGPTGSGKTTTLHSVLNYLNTPDTKIWTAEDPVEITQKGLRQVQVNRKAGLDFATVMRAFLRADPDIIMVGEMRDKETVSMGIEASLTGHLVFSTLHTNSAPESIVRLLDMGMDPFNFSDALLGILAQRLAKRLCGKCKQAYEPSPAELDALLAEYCEDLLDKSVILARWKQQYTKDDKFTLYRAVGCDECTKGYKGRVGLHELMIGTDKVKKLLQEHARVAQLLAAALEDGMLTLKMDGIEKILLGITDIKMVRAVCIK